MTERPHGYARYKLDGCRCNVCGWAVSSYTEAREHAIRRGTWQPFIDAGPARRHVEQLLLADIGSRGIAALAGVDRKTIRTLLHGRPDRGTPPTPKIRPETAAAILAVELTLDVLPSRLHIDSTGTVRRLQALVRRGWPQTRLATELGMLPGNFGAVLDRDRVTADTARKAAALYRRLENADPVTYGIGAQAVSRAVNTGLRNSWALPAMWDEGAIDDPDTFPDFTGRCGTAAGRQAHTRLRILPACPPCCAAEKEQRDQRAADRQAQKEAA